MDRKMFGHRLKKRPDHERVPGEPYNDMDSSYGHEKDNPPDYEGKEHVKYKNPGYSKHDIRYPQDEPHMKSHASKQEMHEMEDNYHMDVPDQTEDTLPAKIRRARMKMDAPNQQDPKPILGTPVHNVPYGGEEDTTGEEEMGPNDMQSEGMPKEHRKKMIVAIAKRKMKKGQGYNDRLDESMGSRNGKKSQSYKDRRDESEGEEESHRKRKYAGLKSSY